MERDKIKISRFLLNKRRNFEKETEKENNFQKVKNVIRLVVSTHLHMYFRE